MTLRVLEHLISTKPAFIPSSTIYNRLINQFCMLSRPADARNVFLDMKSRGHHPNIVSYTTLINGFGRVGGLDVARQLFEEMLASGILPNSLTYSVLLKGVLRKRMVEEGRRMTNELWVRMASEEDSSMKNAAFANLIDALCREGCVNEEFAYGQMIDSLCRVGRHHMASRIVYMMRKRGLTPSVVSYNCIVHGLSKEGEGGCMRAYQLFKEGMEFGYMPPESTYQSLVEGLCRVKDVQKARDVTDFKLRREGVATTRIYNIFLYALRLVDNPSEQLNVLVSMFQNQCRPDVVTLNTIIYSFCRIGKVDEALKILNDMLQGKFCTPDVVTFTTILHGLLDVGRIKEALDIFHRKMPECSCSPSTVTYNAVLHGLCKLRSVEKAVSIFHEMVQKSVSADSRTYTVHEAKTFWEDVVWPSSIHDDFVYATVLRGLCNLGRLDEACDFLYELIDCGISPGIVNYNILIDGACKMSLKREAYQVVAEMRKNGLIPDSVTWRILDKLHKGKKIGDTLVFIL
ncbi:unnamed protein product [Spirodela intermedia]|uniref:Uncharacterized protein n=1 Tax=Spirodela intermedia TaxID=51605 RepID=A0A7I8JH47_SPIIN|nr:unnamed protein product [Spirodela intermedia]CAA6669477.1 unnamed protein product [Spirodela intermedia]